MAQQFDTTIGEIDVILKDRVINEIKLNTNNRTDSLCYLFDGIPFVFELDSVLLPTGYLMLYFLTDLLS